MLASPERLLDGLFFDCLAVRYSTGCAFHRCFTDGKKIEIAPSQVNLNPKISLLSFFLLLALIYKPKALWQHLSRSLRWMLPFVLSPVHLLISIYQQVAQYT